MEIRKWGYNYRHPENFVIDRPSGSGDYMLLVVRSPAWIELGGEIVRTEGNSVVLQKKGTPQHFGALGGEYVNDWLHFDADEEDLRLWEELSVPTDRIIHLGSVHLLSELIRAICEELHSGSLYGREIAHLYGKTFWYRLAELCCLDQPKEMQIHYDRLKALRNSIYHSPEQTWQVDAMAKDVALSRSYFQHLYARFFGNGVMRDVIESRISHAKYLLQSTQESVTGIAARCGYQSEAHFMRQFKKEVGMSPGEFRKKR